MSRNHSSPVSNQVDDDQNHRSVSGEFRAYNAKKCVICSIALSVGEQAVGKTCSRIECKNRDVRDQANRELRRKAALQDRMHTIEKSLIEADKLQADSNRSHGILPANVRRLTGLSKQRIGPFVDRLMGIISQAAAIHYGNAELQDDGVGYETTAELTEQQLATLGNGCAVCRGHCCAQGNGHAFIHVDTILGYMRQNPQQRPRDVLHAYVSRIGAKAYEDSCVYQAADGCTLPREMRSKVCNGYLCKGLHEILVQLDGPAPREVFVISVSDYYPAGSNDVGDADPATVAATIDAQKVVRHAWTSESCPSEDDGDGPRNESDASSIEI